MQVLYHLPDYRKQVVGPGWLLTNVNVGCRTNPAWYAVLQMEATMRIQRFRTVPLLGMLMAFGLATMAQAYGADTHRSREHRRNNSHNRREAQRPANQGYYGNQQGYGNRGNDPYYRDPYYNDRTGAAYGRGTYGTAGSGNVINRVLYNLDVAAANSRVDGHERGHFNKAQQELRNFQARWAQGQFDTGRLDKAVSAIQDLVNSDQVNSRDRSVLSNDLAALRQFRNSGGQRGYYDPSYRNNSYGYRNSPNHPD